MIVSNSDNSTAGKLDVLIPATEQTPLACKLMDSYPLLPVPYPALDTIVNGSPSVANASKTNFE